MRFSMFFPISLSLLLFRLRSCHFPHRNHHIRVANHKCKKKTSSVKHDNLTASQGGHSTFLLPSVTAETQTKWLVFSFLQKIQLFSTPNANLLFGWWGELLYAVGAGIARALTGGCCVLPKAFFVALKGHGAPPLWRTDSCTIATRKPGGDSCSSIEPTWLVC